MMSTKTPIRGLIITAGLIALMAFSLGCLFLFGFSVDNWDNQPWAEKLIELMQDEYYQHVTWFSLYQAAWSTLISVGLAIPVAHALFHSEFKGKQWLLSLFSTTLVLPVLVGVFGVLAILGNSGWLSHWLSGFDVAMPFSIYGLNGILVAHVFFNLPYASRLLLQALEATPIEQRQLCQHLGMTGWQQFRLVEWPRLRTVLPALVGLVFLLCFTSFSVVMTLGGGPKSTTLELLIYQAIKFDFDLSTGAILALWQMLLCSVFGGLIIVFTRDMPSTHTRLYRQYSTGFLSCKRLLWQGFWIGFSMLLVLLPLLSVVIEGINAHILTVLNKPLFWRALITSLGIALCASALALIFGLCIVETSRMWRFKHQNKKANALEWVGNMILITPAIVISTGLFLALRNMSHLPMVAFSIVVVINSVMALPYVIHALSQPMFNTLNQYHYLSKSLGLSGWRRFVWVEWKALKGILLRAFAVSFMVSMGDLSAIALFGHQEFITLPLYLYQLLGSYQMPQAAVVSLVLLIFTLVVFGLMERLSYRSSQVH